MTKRRRPTLEQPLVGRKVGGFVSIDGSILHPEVKWVDDLDAHHERQLQQQMECLRRELRRLRAIGPLGRAAERAERARMATINKAVRIRVLNHSPMLDSMKRAGLVLLVEEVE